MCGGMLMMPGRKETKAKEENQKREKKEKPKINLGEWRGELGGP